MAFKECIGVVMLIGSLVTFIADNDIGIIIDRHDTYCDYYRVYWLVLSDGDGWYTSAELEVICK